MCHRHSITFQKDLSKNPQTVLWKLQNEKIMKSDKTGVSKAGSLFNRGTFALLYVHFSSISTEIARSYFGL